MKTTLSLSRRLARLETKRYYLIRHLDDQATDEFWAQGQWAGLFLGLVVGLLVGNQSAGGLYHMVICLLIGYMVGTFWGIAKWLVGKPIAEHRLYQINNQIEVLTFSLERANEDYGVPDGAISPVRLEDQAVVNERSISLVVA